MTKQQSRMHRLRNFTIDTSKRRRRLHLTVVQLMGGSDFIIFFV